MKSADNWKAAVGGATMARSLSRIANAGRLYGLTSTASGWRVVAALCLVVLVFQIMHGYGRTTSDSHQYMGTALTYQQERRVEFEAWREYGYAAAILAVSRLVPWETPAGLAKWVTAFQIAAYLLLFAGLIAVAGRWGGPWWAALTGLAFAIDPFNARWIAHVMSEAPSELLALAAILALQVGWHTARPFLVAASMFMLGLVPLFRSADIAFPVAAAIGWGIYVLLGPSRVRALRAVGMIALLIGPTYLFCAVQQYRTGFFGLSARGADHVAARFVTLADPERVIASGVDPDLVERVFRPIYKWWNPQAGLRGWVAPGAPDHYFPLTRDRRLINAGAPTLESAVRTYLEHKGRVVTPYTVAAFSAELPALALKADPSPILASIALITWDYMRLPFIRNYWGEAYPQIYVWPILWIGLLGFIWRHRRSSQEALGMATAAVVVLPAYWISISMGSSYNPRFATHPYLAVTMALMSACLMIVARTGKAGSAKAEQDDSISSLDDFSSERSPSRPMNAK
jgi:hypothetical protein